MRIAYEIVGSREKSVAIIGSDVKNPKKAAEEIMQRHKAVLSVLQKTDKRQGKFRLHPSRLIKGKRDTEVVHKENGYLIKVDPRKSYFSPREATERQRIVEKVKGDENVLVMFSGVAPFAIAIAKKHPHTKITCVEMNLEAVKYAVKSVHLNRLTNVKNICWDVRKSRNLGIFDRIIMPLPETAIEFIDVAVLHSKKGTIIHLYGFSKGFAELEKKVKEKAKIYNFKYKIVGRQKVLPFSPGVSKNRLDIKVL
ncbi:MAG: methyltransferase [Candidatus Aenigmarchaeota archaeon]|nr:methyltransferase [Candidatus Aenigmarchaeota archaeon]